MTTPSPAPAADSVIAPKVWLLKELAGMVKGM